MFWIWRIAFVALALSTSSNAAPNSRRRFSGARIRRKAQGSGYDIYLGSTFDREADAGIGGSLTEEKEDSKKRIQRKAQGSGYDIYLGSTFDREADAGVGGSATKEKEDSKKRIQRNAQGSGYDIYLGSNFEREADAGMRGSATEEQEDSKKESPCGECLNGGHCSAKPFTNGKWKFGHHCRCPDYATGDNCEFNFRWGGVRLWASNDYPSRKIGRLEVRIKGRWGAVCVGNNDVQSIAKMACSSFGMKLEGVGTQPSMANKGVVEVKSLKCDADAWSIHGCEYEFGDCPGERITLSCEEDDESFLQESY